MGKSKISAIYFETYFSDVVYFKNNFKKNFKKLIPSLVKLVSVPHFTFLLQFLGMYSSDNIIRNTPKKC